MFVHNYYHIDQNKIQRFTIVHTGGGGDMIAVRGAMHRITSVSGVSKTA